MTAWLLLGGCGAVLTWFAGRARAGARVRQVAGVRLRLVARAATVVSSRRVAGAVVGLLAGSMMAGAGGAAAGSIAGFWYDPLRRRRHASARAREIQEQLPDVLRAIGSAVRAGRSLPQALEAARDDAPHAIRDPLHHAVRRLEVGAPVDDALTVFERRAGVPAAAAAVQTIRVARAAGGDLPAVLDVAVESLLERARIERDRRATTAQARLSALVVGAMPLAFFAIVGPSARTQMSLLFGEPIGWLLLGTGAFLEAAGALWMRALLRTA